MSLFREANGQISSARLMSLLLVMSGILYAFIYKDVGMTAILLSYGTGVKLIQKPFEKK